MKEGDVILTPVPQANGIIKNRPAVVLRQMPPFGDLLACGISTQLHQQVAGFDGSITPSDSDFALSGLKSESLIRLDFLALLPRSRIMGSIGSIAPYRHKRLLKTLSDYLIKK